jgi:transposase
MVKEQEPGEPERVSMTAAEMDRLLVQMRAQLSPALYEKASLIFKTFQWLMGLIEKKKTTMRRLQRLIFGSQTEKTGAVFKKGPKPSSERQPAPGHGRNGAGEYPGAGSLPVPHPRLKSGDECPACEKGKLYETPPSRIVRISAQPLFPATIYQLGRLRCNLCGKVFTAPAPPEALGGKYDREVGLMLGLMRYGGGLPHYRMEKMQKDFGVPLPAATQWELIQETVRPLQPVFDELVSVAAQGELLHNDDTTMRVRSLKKEREGSERTGVFTTGIVAQVGEHKLVVFFTGTNHAGENLDQLLERRAKNLAAPIQMCDALSQNPSREFEVLLGNCLAHGRRQFVDAARSFPAECEHVLETLGAVYKNEARIRKLELDPQHRLRRHQEQSGPIMESLLRWMREQMDQKKVEPNSGLGEAIGYMIRHWQPLTLFLRHPGAPLDNNICERALKMSILHRKNSLSYKTENGAAVGDLFMSLIHTCRLCKESPFDYLRAVQSHADQAKQSPGQWLLWNYRQTLNKLQPA